MEVKTNFALLAAGSSVRNLSNMMAKTTTTCISSSSDPPFTVLLEEDMCRDPRLM